MTRKIPFALAYSVAIWCWVFALTGMAIRFLSRESRVQRYLADASYWVYLIHAPLVHVFRILFAPLSWHWSITFPAILGPTMAASLVTYQLFVRYTLVGAILNGRRRTRPSSTASGSMPLRQVGAGGVVARWIDRR